VQAVCKINYFTQNKHFLRDSRNEWKKAIEKAEYSHENPVKRRLVKSAEQWRCSSFGWLVLEKRNGPLRVDEWDETIPEYQPNSTRLNDETCGTQNTAQTDATG